jgi:hypothetical protein
MGPRETGALFFALGGGEVKDAGVDVAVHLSPARRDKANFLIFGAVELEGELRWEQLWCLQMSDNTFDLCCVPFFLYDLAIGDVVETKAMSGRKFVIARRVKPSGLRTIRAWYSSESLSEDRERGVVELQKCGAIVEWYSERLLSFACTAEDLPHLRAFFEREQREGVLKFEIAA